MWEKIFQKCSEFGAFYFSGYRNMDKAFYEVLDPHPLKSSGNFYP
jgi:hypothetical protein